MINAAGAESAALPAGAPHILTRYKNTELDDMARMITVAMNCLNARAPARTSPQESKRIPVCSVTLEQLRRVPVP
jgi:hypothetical protein